MYRSVQVCRIFGLAGAVCMMTSASAQQQPASTPPVQPLAQGELAGPNAAAGPGKLVPPSSPTGWYSSAEMEHALQASVTLGQPLALMWTEPMSTCPKCQAQTNEWLQARELSAFVRVLVPIKNGNQPPLLSSLLRQAAGKAGQYIPQLYLGTPTGQFLGVVPNATERTEFINTIGTALQQFGGMVPPDQMLDLWKKLGQARQFWSEGKFVPALRAYQEIKRAESVNPNLAIFQELKRDEPQILKMGEEELAAVSELVASGDQRKARTELANIRRRYAGFQTAEDAKELQQAKPAQTAAPATEAVAADASPMRSWTDATGKHRIEAELVAVKEGWVRLKRVSGESVSLPIARLSQPDQDYVGQWQAK
ncbi:MAG: SHD1 domain-containing protein [Patescibacteria group bacterium]|nr:SHD1 domain-containing protein [Patescibacteria group bacterium]